MATAFATYSDLEDIWRSLTDTEQTVATTRLAQASAYLRRLFALAGKDVDALIDSGDLSADLVKAVVVDMVHRVMLNPNKMRQFSKSIDDFQTSGTVDSSVSSGAIYLTDQEAALLGLPRTGSRSFSIVPSYPE